jgi:hypothetical protein
MTTWGGAYHWGKDSPISAVKALQLREAGRLEAGDCWCCKDCYEAKPRKGIQIFPREHKTTSHFWVGSGASYTLSECEGYKLQKAKGESFRYTQFYRNLKTWLSSDEAKLTLQFSDYEEERSRKYSDFLLQLEQPVLGETKLSLLIIHKNRKRRPFHPLTILIDLSHWTLEQLNDFANGKRKIIEELEQLTHPSEPEQPSFEEEVYEEDWQNSLVSIISQERAREVVRSLNSGISQVIRNRKMHSDLLEVEDFLSENDQDWKDLTFDEFSGYFRKHLKQHFPLVCSGSEKAFRDVVESMGVSHAKKIDIWLPDPSLEIIFNQINEIHEIEIKEISQWSRGKTYVMKDRNPIMPYFCAFLKLAKAQWNRVKSETKYKRHRPVYADGDEVDDLEGEIEELAGRNLSPLQQFELHKKLEKKQELVSNFIDYNSRWAIPDRHHINRFVYYLFFGKYRKSNRWI